MKRLSLSHLFKSWRRPRRLQIPDGTYHLTPTGDRKFRMVRLSEAEAEEAAGKHHYWAIVDEDHPVTAPYALVRQVGSGDEREAFYGNGWSRTDLLIRIEWGREDFEVVSVSDEDVERITRFLVDRYETARRQAAEPGPPPTDLGPTP
ncbi:hypothetical protein AB0M80_41645 [Amycolatopsis sp. NPDC051045]|uniref:hypothetical protein n=1 Tax=Amycolatopsis sp. NPDC051045 TaxID=3156922 RepID=UPI0034405F7F